MATKPSTLLHGTNSYIFTVEALNLDVSEEIKVDVEDDKELEITYLTRYGRSLSKRLKLPQDANTDAAISAVYLNNELVISVKRLNRSNALKRIEIKII
ncbi:hypothetical protein BVC80_9037g36 [Macleaya cordata]|uniref:SHSP domain-containing protein n=1 Tax=Macleaya cordata TaxID=56857 RepID=A0A200Q5L5_MACCD|nr:hypothetical protein BVC80_9037g36 [Macleaya cordata]